MTSVKYWRLHVLRHRADKREVHESDEIGGDTIPVMSTDQSEKSVAAAEQSVNNAAQMNAAGPSGPRNCHSEPSRPPESVASFVLKLRSKNVTEKTCRDILEYMNSFTKDAILEHSELPQVPGQEGKEPRSLRTLNEALQSSHLDEHVLKKCSITPPQTITLCADADGKMETYEYVPLTPQLKRLCPDEACLLSVPVPNDSVSGREAGGDDAHQMYDLHGIWDGSLHQTSAKNTLHLSMYYDDFQVGNPLSSKAKDSKVGAIYCAVNNLKDGIQVENIILLMIFYEKLLRKHSWARLLEPLMTELTELETQGLCFDSGIKIPVRLAAVLGDNLGVHSIAGLSTSFHGGAMMCRHCLGTKDEIQQKTAVTDFELRTRDEYDAKIRLLEELNYEENMCLAFGIKRPCPFNGLAEFHCMTSLPPDLMHDLLEGVVPSTIGLVTNKLINENIVTLEDLNKSIRTFPYARLDVNHPGTLRRHGASVTVKGKASEMWCLLRLFPLILLLAGVPMAVLSTNPNIRLVSKLIKIVLLALSFTISQAEATVLEKRVEEFLSDLRILFPSFCLTPKYHYMLHYGQQTLRHGPLRRLWSMRFEAKHQILKQSVATSKNRKNLPKSMAARHQVKQYVDRDADHESRPLLFRGALSDTVRGLVKDAPFFRRAEINDTEYNSGDVVHTHSGLKQVIGVGDFPDGRSLVAQSQKCLYDADVGAFWMIPEENFERVQLLQNVQPMGSYNIEGATYAVPRHHLRNCGMLST